MIRVTDPAKWEAFKQSEFWLDIVDELRVNIEEIHSQLEDPSMDLTDKVLHRLGGNAQALREVLIIPDRFILDLNEGTKNSHQNLMEVQQEREDDDA